MSGQTSGILATTALSLRKKTKRSRLEGSSGHGPGLLLSLARSHVRDSIGFGWVCLSGGNALPHLQIDDDTTRAASRPSVVIRLADVMLRIEIMTKLGNEIELSLQKVNVLLLIAH